MKKRNTLQKKIVFDVFSRMHNHPSAGMVYEQVAKDYPNISRATVFRILAEAAEQGVISRLTLNHCADRYDVTTHPHHHIVCRVCEAVADVDLACDDASMLSGAVGHEGFTVEQSHVEFVGLCPNCQRNQ